MSKRVVTIDEIPKTVEFFKLYPSKYIELAINKLNDEDIDLILKYESGDDNIFDKLKLSSYITMYNILGKMNINWGHDIYKDIKHSKETIDEAIKKLDDYSRKIVFKTIKMEELTKREDNEYKKIVRKLNNIIKNSKYVETIYILCNQYTKEEIDKVLLILDDKDKKELELRYGDDLEKPIRSKDYTKENGKYFLYELLPKIQYMLKNKIYEPLNKPKAVIKVKIKKNNTNVDTKKEIKKEKKLSLIEMFKDIEPSHLKLIVKSMPSRYRDIIYLRHTENLDIFRYFGTKNYKKDNEKYNNAIVYLEKLSESYNDFNNDLLKIQNIKDLSIEQLDILYRVHGSKLNVSLPLDILSKEEKKVYYNIIKLLKRKNKEQELKEIKNDNSKQLNQNKKENKKIEKSSVNTSKSIEKRVPGHSLEEIKKVIPDLNNKHIEVIYKRYGKNLDEYNELSTEENTLLSTAIRRINYVLNEKVMERKMIINKFPNNTLDELKSTIIYLNDNHRKIIYKRYGENLDEYNVLTVKENGVLTNALKSLKRKLKNKENSVDGINTLEEIKEELSKLDSKKSVKIKSITDRVQGHTLEEIKEVICKLDDRYKEVIYKRYGKNLDEFNALSTSENYILSTAFTIIRYDLNNEEKKDRSILAKFPNNTLEEIEAGICKLNLNYQEIIYERYGENLDEYNKISSESHTLCYNALKKLSKVLENKKNSNDKLSEISQEKRKLRFKRNMYKKYNDLLSINLSLQEIETLIDESIEKYDNDFDRERYILSNIYSHLNKFVNENSEILKRNKN